jgi:hypothetical protein
MWVWTLSTKGAVFMRMPWKASLMLSVKIDENLRGGQESGEIQAHHREWGAIVTV